MRFLLVIRYNFFRLSMFNNLSVFLKQKTSFLFAGNNKTQIKFILNFCFFSHTYWSVAHHGYFAFLRCHNSSIDWKFAEIQWKFRLFIKKVFLYSIVAIKNINRNGEWTQNDISLTNKWTSQLSVCRNESGCMNGVTFTFLVDFEHFIFEKFVQNLIMKIFLKVSKWTKNKTKI